MMDLPTPGTSTFVAKARDAVKPTDSDKVEVITISDDDDDVERLPLQRQQLRYNITGTFDQCQQLFGASCLVKLTRCQIPANFVEASTKPTVKYEDSSDDDDHAHANSSSSRGNEETRQTIDAASSTNQAVPKLDKSSTGSSSDEEVAEVEQQQHKKKQGRKPAYCAICGKKLTANWYLKIHIRKVHNRKIDIQKIAKEKKKNPGKGKVFKCEDCERSYSSQHTLSFHKRENPNGLCKIKDRAKRSRQEKIEKMAKKLLEEEPRPRGDWTCKICDKKMKAPSNYTGHMASHAGDKRFKCDQCGKGFFRLEYLSEHRKIHTGIQEFGCVFCGKGFYQEHNLFSHLRRHTEEKPYFCGVTGCGAWYRHSNSLKMHKQRIHLKRC